MHRAKIVGVTTYGKGIVQTLFPLGTGMALRLTTARWYTPSGRSIQGATLDSAMGAMHVVDDSTAYRSDAGRRLSGGGGIVPDVRLEPDTLTSAEQRFAQALEGRLPAFRDVLTAYALELRRGGTVTGEDFEVDAAMRREVRRRLEGRGVTMPESVFAGGATIIEQQLGYELARYLFGPAAERRRRIRDDVQLGAAIVLAHRGATPGALLGLAPLGPLVH
jgi:carboxyl-terminal processing protease